MFGGRFEPFISVVEGVRPPLGFFLTSFPTPSTPIKEGAGRLLEPPFGKIEKAFPVPMSFVSALQSQGYWDAYSSWSMLRPSPPLAASARMPQPHLCANRFHEGYHRYPPHDTWWTKRPSGSSEDGRNQGILYFVEPTRWSNSPCQRWRGVLPTIKQGVGSVSNR